MKKLLTYVTASLALLAITVYAATSYTTHYDLAKPADGDSNWGDSYRENMDIIDTQMYVNQTTISDHISDTTGAHAATAISTTTGSVVCLTQITVQAYLDCLDAQVGAITGGTVVTTNTAQTITGLKTFSTTPIFSALSTGLLHSDASGVLTSSLLVNADVDASAAIDYGKLNLADAIVDADINSSAGILYSKLDLADSIVNADINSAAAIGYSKLNLSGSIVNADVNASAAIDGTKIDPDFGSQNIDTTGDLSAQDVTGTQSVLTPLVKATTSAGVAIQGNSATLVATLGAGSGAQAVFEGALETKTSLVIQDPGVGTNSVTVTAPSGLSGNYSLTLPDNDGSANQVLGTNGSGTLSWVDATSGYSQNSDTALTASDTIAIGTGNADRLQHWRVQSNGGPVTLSTTPFGTSAPQDRTIICLIGLSDADTVTIVVNDAADGVVGQGDITLGQYDSACFRYLSTEDRYVIESRSN